MIGNIRLLEILFIVLCILLLFGARKIPDLMKNLGKGISSFKQGLNDTEAKEPESEKGKDEQTNA